jgi:hypothetical protein
MSFFRTHGPPTLHNAVGGLLTLGVLAVGGLIIAAIKPAREMVASALWLPVPLWLSLLLLTAILVPLLWCLLTYRRKFKAASAERDGCRTQLQTVEAEIERLTKEPAGVRAEGGLHESAVKILKHLAFASRQNVGQLSRATALSDLKTKYYVTELAEQGFVDAQHFYNNLPSHYSLAQKGRGYLVSKNLIE